MHHLTRSTIAASVLILAVGAALAMQPRATTSTITPVTTESTGRVGNLDLDDPSLTQRQGEWSPLCAATQNPLVDFSPVDRGSGRHRVLLTVQNCSSEPVTLDQEPSLWFGGRESMAEHIRLDPELTTWTSLTLTPRESATAILTWEAFDLGATSTEVTGGTLSVRIPGIGEGELRDEDLHDLTPSARIWMSGWTPA